jgi:hypothetical protein
MPVLVVPETFKSATLDSADPTNPTELTLPTTLTEDEFAVTNTVAFPILNVVTFIETLEPTFTDVENSPTFAITLSFTIVFMTYAFAQ